MNTSGAIFSTCRRYRYALWRTWDTKLPVCMFLMLNPSTADEDKNDPTISRCVKRSVLMGYGGLHVGNIFAWRSTDPKGLLKADDPVGPDNDRHILEAAGKAGVVICGYGTHGALNRRGEKVLGMLYGAGVTPQALKINSDGSPGHPLYVGYDVKPTPMYLFEDMI